MRDEPNAFDKTWLREAARLEIPLRSVVNLRRVASELRGLAERLDFLSRDPSETPEVLHQASRAVHHTQSNLRKIRAPGRPRKRVHSTRWLQDIDR